MPKRLFFPLAIFTFIFTLFSACTQTPSPSSGKLTVVATTTLIGDVAANVGGDLIDLSVMIPVGADPHSFEPTPADLSKVADAGLVFINGIEFEAFLEKLIENAGDASKVVTISEGISLMALAEEADEHAEHEEGEEHGEHEEDHDEHADEGDDHDEDMDADHGHDHGEFDPHVWQDPNNVIVWANNIAVALSERDPGNAAAYQANAAAYVAELQALDAWVQEQVGQILPANRRFVTEHGTMGYFAARYGFQVVGAVLPAFSTLAAPSAQELASLADAIRDLDVKAILVGNTVNPALAAQLAQDTGIQLVPIFTDSLSNPDGPASTYLDFMRYNVEAIAEALK